MPRGRPRAQLSIAELHRLLKERDRQVRTLRKRRRDLASDLAAVDKQIAALTGGRTVRTPAAPAPARRRRARGGMTLPQAITKVLTGAGKPMRLKVITQAVLDGGYETTSKDFYNVVSQTLHTRDEFKNVARGVYTLAGRASARPAPKAAKRKTRKKRKPKAAK